MKVSINTLSSGLFLRLYTSAGWEPPGIEQVERCIREHMEDGWAVSLELISTKEAVGFYQKKGFEERPCEWDGPGMFKMIR